MNVYQMGFSPTDYCWKWTDDGWYEWDSKEAKKQALAARNREAKKLQQQGYTVRKWSQPGQLITKGGIGTGKPQIEEVVTVYRLDYC